MVLDVRYRFTRDRILSTVVYACLYCGRRASRFFCSAQHMGYYLHGKPKWNHCIVCNGRTLNEWYCSKKHHGLDMKYGSNKIKWAVGKADSV